MPNPIVDVHQDGGFPFAVHVSSACRTPCIAVENEKS